MVSRRSVIGGTAMSFGISHFLDKLESHSRVEERDIADRVGDYPSDPERFVDEVLGGGLWSAQREIIRSVAENKRTAVRSGYSVGKGLALDTPLPTPDGWTTMGAVQAGDWLLNEEGKPVRVAMVSEIHNRDCYRVTFSDGSELITDDEHRWSVVRRLDARRSKKNGVRDYREMWDMAETITTPELKRTLRHTGEGWSHANAMIPLARALDLPERHLPIDPYVLGVWLGDGNTSAPAITTGDDEEMIALFEERGWGLRERVSQRTDGCRAYGMIAPLGGPKAKTIFRETGLIGNKHIPAEYMRASEQQRRDLLAGLMDTDGSATLGRKEATIDLSNRKLATDVLELVRTLGYKANMREGTVAYNGERRKRYRIAFAVDRSVFKLMRKTARIELAETGDMRNTMRTVVSVEPVESVPTKCLTVESERSLYLAGEQMIPTHNTYLSSKAAIWFLHTHPNSIVITTAPSDRQVTNILWRYIRRDYSQARVPLLGKPFTKKVEIDDDWYGLGFKGSDENTDALQGFHAEHILVIVDEAAGVSETLLRAADSILTGTGSRLLLIGNPTSMSGMFRAAFHEESHRYNQITINAFDTPNFTAFGITKEDMLNGKWEEKIAGKSLPYPAMVDPYWVSDLIDTHGVDHPWVEAAVFAKFPSGATNVLIPLADIEAAENREEPIDRNAPLYAGVDVARTGEDETVICVRQGIHVIYTESWQGQKTMETVGRIQDVLRRMSVHGDLAEVRVDVVGIGAGVVDRLEELGYPVVEVNVASKSSDRTAYRNLRQEMWHQLRALYREGLIAFADESLDRETKKQLSDIRIQWNSQYTQPVVESKEDAKKRGSKSPDRAEAQAMAFLTLPPEETGPESYFGIGVVKR